MSAKATAIVWQSDLKHAEKWILLAYADHADDQGGSIFPSVLRISWKTGYSVRQVKRITKTLRDEKYMVPVREHERHKPAVYQIIFDNLPILIPWKFVKKHYKDGMTMAELKNLYINSQNAGSVRGDNLSGRGDNLSGRGDNLSARGDNLSPDPIKDPLYNKGVEPEQASEDIRSRQDYIDLQNAVVMVCKKVTIVALLEKEVRAIDILYGEMDAKPDEIRTYYGQNLSNGRGKKGQFPEPVDIQSTLGQARAFKLEQAPTPSNAATKAWSEVLLWINQRMKVADFSSPLTIQVVRVITESELKSMPENKEGFYKKRFVGLFKDLEQKQQHR
jgi:hypothetical protein